MDPSFRLRSRKIAAWSLAGIFFLGFFISHIGVVTAPVLGAWFVGTQRLRRGFLWMLGFAVLLSLPELWRGWPHGSAGAVLVYGGWSLFLLVLGVLPFTLYRLTSARLSGFASTLPLPVYAVLSGVVIAAWLPANVAADGMDRRILLRGRPASIVGAGVSVFLIYWFAAWLIRAWNQEFRTKRIRPGAILFAVVCLVAGLLAPFGQVSAMQAGNSQTEAGLTVCWVALAVALTIWAMSRRMPGWECRPETLAILQSPVTGAPLKVAGSGQGRLLASSGGERFPFRDDLPDLRCPEDMTGANEHYNHLYETIGGFYDDVQRVGCAFLGIDRDAYVMSYLGLLEIESGDSVLETSVGTGLNFKYLPRAASLTGIDLSPEMLIRCQSNLLRWGMSADLLLANAESLPFADCSFDVVFHVGGINFFNDRARAIREMIRVARPGSRILIADETEEHVKAAYERGPITSSYYRNRREAVTAPVDLVPAEMREIRLEILNVVGKNRYYALTFRKPVRDCSHPESIPPAPETLHAALLSR